MRLLPPERYNELKATGRLPSPKGVAMAIIKLLQRDDFPIEDLVKLVQSDPAISGRLLKFANAAAFGRARPIVSLQRAIVALGSFRVRDLVVGFSVLQSHLAGECAHFDYGGFWSHSLATAIACQDLARYAQIASEENFTLGLLARVGELGLATLFPDAYGEILAQGGERAELLDQEKARFGFDHRELGASMLAEWGLPEILIRATFHHEAPEVAELPDGSRLQTLTLTLNFAHSLAEVCMAEDERRWGLLPTLVTRSARLGIAPEALAGMADDIVQRWREWGAMLHIRTKDLPPFADLLAASPPRPPVGSEREEGPAERELWLVAPADTDTDHLAAQLEGQGYRVGLITDPERAVAASALPAPDMLVLDLELAGFSAADYCETFRHEAQNSDTYILVVAQPEHEAAAMHLLEAGADDVLFKPITPHNLRLRLNLAHRMLHLRQEITREREGVVRSAEEFAGAHRRLIEAALTDPLTNLPNRRHGLDFLQTEWTAAQDNSRPLSLLMLDIDHFKQINDRYGHPAGDAVLHRLAELLRAISRAEDLVFRYGGEEFAVVLPGAPLATAIQVAERIRRLTAVETFEWQNEFIAVTVSIGAAGRSERTADAEALVNAADEALYQAKQNGRNRVAAART